MPFKAKRDDYFEDNDFVEEKPKQKKLLLSKGKSKALLPTDRFNTTVSEKEIALSSKGCIPANTSRSTQWALRVYYQWINQRNKWMNEQFPLDLFEKPYTAREICSCLQWFVMEARKEDGSHYPPKTLYLMLCAFLRHSREVQSDPMNFLDRKDARFKELHGTCDVIFHSLHEDGVGAVKKTTPILQKEHEIKFWDSNVFNTTTPEGLQRVVFYYVDKVEEVKNKGT